MKRNPEIAFVDEDGEGIAGIVFVFNCNEVGSAFGEKQGFRFREDMIRELCTGSVPNV